MSSSGSNPGDPILLLGATPRAAGIRRSADLNQTEVLREAPVLGRGSYADRSHIFLASNVMSDSGWTSTFTRSN